MEDGYLNDLHRENSEVCKRAIAWQSEQPYSRENAQAQVQRLKERTVKKITTN